jgi:Flp pilus assembly pilin Flp
MRALAGLLAFVAIVMIAVIMIIQEQIKIRKNKSK